MFINKENFYSYSLNDILSITDSSSKKELLELYNIELKKLENDSIGKLFVDPNESLEEIYFNIDTYLNSITSNYLFPNDKIKFYPSIKELRAKETITCDFSGAPILKNSYYCLYRPLIHDLDSDKKYVLKKSIKVELSYRNHLPLDLKSFETFINNLENSYSLNPNDTELDYYSIAANLQCWSLLELNKNKKVKFYSK